MSAGGGQLPTVSCDMNEGLRGLGAVSGSYRPGRAPGALALTGVRGRQYQLGVHGLVAWVTQ